MFVPIFSKQWASATTEEGIKVMSGRIFVAGSAAPPPPPHSPASRRPGSADGFFRTLARGCVPLPGRATIFSEEEERGRFRTFALRERTLIALTRGLPGGEGVGQQRKHAGDLSRDPPIGSRIVWKTKTSLYERCRTVRADFGRRGGEERREEGIGRKDHVPYSPG